MSQTTAPAHHSLSKKRTLLKAIKTLKISRRARESVLEVRKLEGCSDQPHLQLNQQRTTVSSSRSRHQGTAHTTVAPESGTLTATLSRKWILQDWPPPVARFQMKLCVRTSDWQSWIMWVRPSCKGSRKSELLVY